MSNLQKEMKNLSVAEKKPKYGKVALAEKKTHDPKRKLPGIPVELSSNLRKISIASNCPIYKYTVSMLMILKDDDYTHAVEISKSKKKDAEHMRDMFTCRMLYLKLLSNVEFSQEGSYFYDLQQNLYSLQIIPNAENGLSFTFPAAEFTKRDDVDRFEITIKPCNHSFQSTSNDLKNTVNSVPLDANKTLIEALNHIVSDGAVKNSNVITLGASVHYLMDPEKAGILPTELTGFNEKTLKYGGIGISTAVKTLTGPTADGYTAYVVTELKKSTFHADTTQLMDKLRGLDNFEESMTGIDNFDSGSLAIILKSIKGLHCYLNYGANRELGEDASFVKIKGFGPPPKQVSFPQNDGKQISVYDYFTKKLNVSIQYPQYKTIVCRGKNSKHYYPIECLNVCNSQIARNEQLILREQEEAIKKSVVVPKMRKEQTDKIVEHIGLSGRNIGGVVDVASQGETLTGRILPKPVIFYGRNKLAQPNDEKSNWRAEQFLEPKALDKWEVIVIASDIDYKYYISQLKSKATQLGMQVTEPKYKVIPGYELENVFRSAKNNGTEFMFFIARDALNLHSMIKNYEQAYDIITQEVRETVAKRTIQKNQTQILENVIAKTNIKLGGLNYTVHGGDYLMKHKEAVFIGFESSQKNCASDAPIAISYAANVLDNYQKFAGGYKYTLKGPDPYGGELENIIAKVIETTEKNRGKKPRWIVCYFNGLSEGQYAMINEKYVELIKNACMQFTGYRPHITIMAVSKTHNERIYNRDITGNRADEQNVKPGTIVDNVIVSPVFTEFYLTAQNAFQGTAKSPKFTVIFDTSKIPLDEIQSTTYHLCFLHEIVTSTISLPAPLTIADRYSKRATMLFNTRGIAASGKYGNGDDVPWDLENINKELTYEGKSMEFVRFNA